MFSEIRKRSKKAGQPPGSLTYTGSKKDRVPRITFMGYSENEFFEKTGLTLEETLPDQMPKVTQWIHVDGLSNTALIQQLAKLYEIHPLTIEDILNVDQRSKVEEFDHYIYITLKILYWNFKRHTFLIRQVSLVIGKDFVLSFQDENSNLFENIRERIRNTPYQGLQKKNSDYLAYRLIDTVVDNYFLVLEGLGDQIEKVEDVIISNPTKQTARLIYHLKRQVLVLRKAIWPTRDVMNHLFKLEGKLISDFTRVYLRDVYDHAVQAIDTIEVFREMLSNMLDIYLSSLTNRMNEVIKVLTIIATTFIPVTFIASIYGMNFVHMPELQWEYGYPAVLTFMILVMLVMLYYFRRKNWW